MSRLCPGDAFAFCSCCAQIIFLWSGSQRRVERYPRPLRPHSRPVRHPLPACPERPVYRPVDGDAMVSTAASCLNYGFGDSSARIRFASYTARLRRGDAPYPFRRLLTRKVRCNAHLPFPLKHRETIIAPEITGQSCHAIRRSSRKRRGRFNAVPPSTTRRRHLTRYYRASAPGRSRATGAPRHLRFARQPIRARGGCRCRSPARSG